MIMSNVRKDKMGMATIDKLIYYASISSICGQAHGISVLIAYAQKLPLNAHTAICSGATFVIFGLSLHLRQYVVYASSEGSGESVHMHRLARAFAARNYNKYKISCSGSYIKESSTSDV